MAAIRAAVAAPAAALDAADESSDATMVMTARSPAAGAQQPRPAEISASALAASIAPPATSQPARAAGVGEPKAKSSRLPIFAGVGVAGLAVLGGVGYFLLTGNSGTPQTGATSPPAPSSQAGATSPPGPAQTGSAMPQGGSPSGSGSPPNQSLASATATPEPAQTGTNLPPGPLGTGTAAPSGSSPAGKPIPPGASLADVGSPPGPSQSGISAPTAPSQTATAAPPGSAQPGATSPPLGSQTSPTLPPGSSQVGLASPPPGSIPSQTLPPGTDPSDAIRAQVAAVVSQLPCSVLGGDVHDGAVQLTGIAGPVAMESLQQKLTAQGLTNPAPALHVTQVEARFCPWENFLRPIAKPFGAGEDDLKLRLADDPPWLVNNDFIRPRVTMAGFRGVIRVDYLDREGNVQHLFPQVADPAQHLTGDRGRRFEPGEVLNLGEPGPGKPGWQVAPPFGTDLIIAVASEDVLFDHPRPTNVESAEAYLRDLKRAVEFARSRGAHIAATVMPVVTKAQ
jgi:hypothetical protein